MSATWLSTVSALTRNRTRFSAGKIKVRDVKLYSLIPSSNMQRTSGMTSGAPIDNNSPVLPVGVPTTTPSPRMVRILASSTKTSVESILWCARKVTSLKTRRSPQGWRQESTKRSLTKYWPSTKSWTMRAKSLRSPAVKKPTVPKLIASTGRCGKRAKARSTVPSPPSAIIKSRSSGRSSPSIKRT